MNIYNSITYSRSFLYIDEDQCLKIKKLNIFQMILRKVFGFYKETHSRPVLKKMLRARCESNNLEEREKIKKIIINKKNLINSCLNKLCLSKNKITKILIYFFPNQGKRRYKIEKLNNFYLIERLINFYIDEDVDLNLMDINLIPDDFFKNRDYKPRSYWSRLLNHRLKNKEYNNSKERYLVHFFANKIRSLTNKQVLDQELSSLVSSALYKQDQTTVEFLESVANEFNIRLIWNPTDYLLNCICSGKLDFFEYLFKRGANINMLSVSLLEMNTTLLMYAIKCEKSEIAAFLIDEISREFKRKEKNFSTYLEQQDGKGYTALSHAVIKENKEIFTSLTNQESDLQIKDNQGNSLIILACRYNKDPAILQHLLALGANVNDTNLNNETPLIVASQSNNLEAVKLLLEKPLNTFLDCSDKKGKTALEYACLNRHYGIVKTLLESGAKPEVSVFYEKGDTPLHYFCRELQLDAVQAIIDHPGLLEAKNSKEQTPLLSVLDSSYYTWVDDEKRIRIAEFLIEKGANQEVTNHEGKTASQILNELKSLYKRQLYKKQMMYST